MLRRTTINLAWIEQLAAVVTQRASCVIELEGGAPLTIRQPDAAAHIPATHKAPALLSQYHPLHFPLDHARDSTIRHHCRRPDFERGS